MVWPRWCACGADGDYEPASEPELAEGEELYSLDELGTTEQAVSAACGGDDSNALAAALAVAIGNELGRWDVNTDFQIVTRAKSLPHPVADKAEFAKVARALLDEQLPLPLPIRLMGLTLSGLEGEKDDRPRDEAQLSLL